MDQHQCKSSCLLSDICCWYIRRVGKTGSRRLVRREHGHRFGRCNFLRGLAVGRWVKNAKVPFNPRTLGLTADAAADLRVHEVRCVSMAIFTIGVWRVSSSPPPVNKDAPREAHLCCLLFLTCSFTRCSVAASLFNDCLMVTDFILYFLFHVLLLSPLIYQPD